MKNLLLLRHAKSSWKDPDLLDQERPLKKRGRRAAALIGRFMSSNNLQPELVLSSTATRARQTVELVLESGEFDAEVRYQERLYLASPATLLETVAQLDSRKQQVLLVGHNPGLEEFLQLITGVEETMPTGALAHILMETETWSDISARTTWRLESLVRPKALITR